MKRSFHTCVGCLAEMIAAPAVWTWGVLGNVVRSHPTNHGGLKVVKGGLWGLQGGVVSPYL